MADMWEETARSFLRDIKAAVQEVQRHLEHENLSIDKVELELKTTVDKKADGTLKFKIVEIGADVSHEDVQTLGISLKPGAGGVNLMAGISEELTDGIEATVAVTREAAQMQPPFHLDEATVSVEVGMTREGTVKIFVGGSTSRATSHTVTFTIKSKALAD